MRKNPIEDVIEKFKDKQVSICAADLLLLCMAFGAVSVEEGDMTVKEQHKFFLTMASVLDMIVNDSDVCNKIIAHSRRAFERAITQQKFDLAHRSPNVSEFVENLQKIADELGLNISVEEVIETGDKASFKKNRKAR